MEQSQFWQQNQQCLHRTVVSEPPQSSSLRGQDPLPGLSMTQATIVVGVVALVVVVDFAVGYHHRCFLPFYPPCTEIEGSWFRESAS
jgi:hypothetical protein